MRRSRHCISGRRHCAAFSEELQEYDFNEIGQYFSTHMRQVIMGRVEGYRGQEQCLSTRYDRIKAFSRLMG